MKILQQLTGKLEYEVTKADELNILYNIFVAYNCNSCSTAPLTQYENNDIYQEITAEDLYTTKTTDDRVFIDMRRSWGYTDELEKLSRDDSGLAVVLNLKNAATKKLRLRTVGYSQAEYHYAFSKKGYIMVYKNYTISKAEER